MPDGFGKHSDMLSVLIFVMMFLPSPADEESYSSSKIYSGLYLTNFEISYYFPCDAVRLTCDDRDNRMWLRIRGDSERNRLHDCIARWNGSYRRWAAYAITFEGRETLDVRQPAFLHDTERHVVLEKLIALEMIGTDTGALSRYRGQPRMTC